MSHNGDDGLDTQQLMLRAVADAVAEGFARKRDEAILGPVISRMQAPVQVPTPDDANGQMGFLTDARECPYCGDPIVRWAGVAAMGSDPFNIQAVYCSYDCASNHATAS